MNEFTMRLILRYLKHDLPEEIIARFTVFFHGKPDYFLKFNGGIGDDLLCTSVARELKKRGVKKIWIESKYPELFMNNTDINKCFKRPIYKNIKRTFVNYGVHNSEIRKDFVPEGHIIDIMCRNIGLQENVELRPYFYLDELEKKNGFF